MNALYIHVPFCKSICSYCDFKRIVYKEEIADKWIHRIHEDLLKRRNEEKPKTIYIGGGTPTALNKRQMKQLLEDVSYFYEDGCEYTIESNIECLDDELLDILYTYKVNRISLGVQSYQDQLLNIYRRNHRCKDIDVCIQRIIDHNITNISIDLLYGIDIQTLDNFKQDLLYACNNKNIKHISTYSLTIEENSILGKQNRDLVDNEIEAKMYEMAIDILDNNGFHQYEVANFARDGYESKHNKQYWYYNDFVGIGVGASGKENHQRYTINGSIQDYINYKEDIEIINLSKEDEMFEWIMMGLRLREGIQFSIFKERYNLDFKEKYKDVLDTLIKNQYILMNEKGITTTKKGLFYLHDVLVLFME